MLSPESPSAAGSVDSTWARSGLRRRTSTGQDSDLSSPRMRFPTPSKTSKPSSPQVGLLSARVASKAGMHPPGQSGGAREPTAPPSLRQHSWLLHFWDPGEAQHREREPASQPVLAALSLLGRDRPTVAPSLEQHACLLQSCKPGRLQSSCVFRCRASIAASFGAVTHAVWLAPLAQHACHRAPQVVCQLHVTIASTLCFLQNCHTISGTVEQLSPLQQSQTLV